MAHVTYRHESGETVRVVEDDREAERLSATDGWDLVDESAEEEPAQAQPRPARRSSSSTASSSTSSSGGE